MLGHAGGGCSMLLVVAGKVGDSTDECVKRNKLKSRAIRKCPFTLYVDLPFIQKIQGSAFAQQPFAGAAGYDEISI